MNDTRIGRLNAALEGRYSIEGELGEGGMATVYLANRERRDREKQLPVDEAVRIAQRVAGALDYAHRHDIIHRDTGFFQTLRRRMGG